VTVDDPGSVLLPAHALRGTTTDGFADYS